MAKQIARYVPNGFTLEEKDESVGVEIYRGPHKGQERHAVLAFSGRSAKAAIYTGFRSVERADQYTADWLKGVRERAARKIAEREAAKQTPNPRKVGDVLYCSWGYEQTNIDYYEVVELVGKQTVIVRQIGRESVTEGHMQGKCVPMPGTFKGEPLRRRVDRWGGVNIDSVRHATPVKFQEVAGCKIYEAAYWTSYA